MAADKLKLGKEVRPLKLGQTFSNPRSTAFHTIRYDFKPASVDINKMASIDVGSSNQVTVTVPHLDGSGVPQTLFKGSQRPYQKECVLIIDRVTGEITLEKLSSNIQVKKTRSEAYKAAPGSQSTNLTRPLTPIDHSPSPIAQRSSSKTKVTSGRRTTLSVSGSHGLIPKHSPLHASPSHYASPSHHGGVKVTTTAPTAVLERTEPTTSTSVNNNSNSNNTLASLPMIGLDDIVATNKSPLNHHHTDEEQNGEVGILSDSSSSSSSSSDSGSSDSESEPEINRPSNVATTNGKSSNVSVAPEHLLNEDLCLSESATDSD